MDTVKLFSEAVEEVEYITEEKEDGRHMTMTMHRERTSSLLLCLATTKRSKWTIVFKVIDSATSVIGTENE